MGRYILGRLITALSIHMHKKLFTFVTARSSFVLPQKAPDAGATVYTLRLWVSQLSVSFNDASSADMSRHSG